MALDVVDPNELATALYRGSVVSRDRMDPGARRPAILLRDALGALAASKGDESDGAEASGWDAWHRGTWEASLLRGRHANGGRLQSPTGVVMPDGAHPEPRGGTG